MPNKGTRLYAKVLIALRLRDLTAACDWLEALCVHVETGGTHPDYDDALALVERRFA